mmetsp:Transcript_25446/g.59139  ORF Transcript_25446/g.59139 Transcript_25446/m.59139 type:complete len:287 (+) Transcript_25446:1326-2186(+)
MVLFLAVFPWKSSTVLLSLEYYLWYIHYFPMTLFQLSRLITSPLDHLLMHFHTLLLLRVLRGLLFEECFGLHGGVGVEEEKLLVGGKCPEIRRYNSFCGITCFTNIHHSLETKDPGEAGLLVGCFGGVNLAESILELRHGSFQFGERSNSCGLDRWDHMLGDHVNQNKGFHVDSASVVIMNNVLASSALFCGKDAHLLKQSSVLGGSQSGNGLYTRVNTPHTVIRQLLLKGFVVVVSVENNLPVLLESLACNVSGVFSGIHTVGKFGKLGGSDGVEDTVHHGHILR